MDQWKMNIDTDKLLAEHKAAAAADKWNVPFPMGVFGTLRKGWGNTGLMGQPPGQKLVEDAESDFWRRPRNYSYESHYKAFMPHWSATGLSIHHDPGASCVFEIFTYTPDNWEKMIVNVDRLEGFTPGPSRYEYGYHRTLAWLHRLPEDYEHEQYEAVAAYYGSGREPRTLDIPSSEWSKYPRMPCWVYASIQENKASLELKDSPVIWLG